MDLRTRAKEKARRKKCKVAFSIIEKNKAFQENYMKVGVKKLLRAGMMPARTWGAHAVGMSLTDKVEIEWTDGGGSWLEKYNLTVFVHGGIWP